MEHFTWWSDDSFTAKQITSPNPEPMFVRKHQFRKILEGKILCVVRSGVVIPPHLALIMTNIADYVAVKKVTKNIDRIDLNGTMPFVRTHNVSSKTLSPLLFKVWHPAKDRVTEVLAALHTHVTYYVMVESNGNIYLKQHNSAHLHRAYPSVYLGHVEDETIEFIFEELLAGAWRDEWLSITL